MQTKKDDFTTKCIVVAAIFEDSVSGVIPVAVDKINNIVESLSPRLGVNEVGFCCISSAIVGSYRRILVLRTLPVPINFLYTANRQINFINLYLFSFLTYFCIHNGIRK